MTTNNKNLQEREIVIERQFNAPRALVFKAFTEAQHLAQWWGPKGFAIHVKTLEVKPGGTFLYYMQTPDGQLMWGKMVYGEITEPETIVFINSFCDENGIPIRHPMSATWPLEVYNKLTLTEKEGITTLTLTGRPINANEDDCTTFFDNIANMQQGFKGTFDQLEAYLESLK